MLKLAATYAAKRTANDGSAWHALTRGLRRQAELNRRVASDLPLCGPPAIAAAFIFAAGSASVLFHGTQCGCWTFEPLSVPGAGWATRRVDPVFMEPSIFTNTIDVVCAVQLAVFVLACNGGLGVSY